MILLDTHIWYWWVSDSPRLSPRQRELIKTHRNDGLGLSAISIWEVAKKNQLGKLDLNQPLDDWLRGALNYPGITLLPLSSEILVEFRWFPQRSRR